MERPTHTNKQTVVTTPHEQVYKRKVDYRNLIPLFSIAHIKQVREQQQDNNKWKSQSLKCIVVGKCNKSDSVLFYHPPSKQLLSSANGYKYDTFSPAGPQFNEEYDNRFIFNTRSSIETIHTPPSHEEGEIRYINNGEGKIMKVRVLSIPVDEEKEKYVIQECESGNISEILAEELLDHNPETEPSEVPSGNPLAHIPWLKDNSKVTIIVTAYNNAPKQGRIRHDTHDQKWYF